MVVYVQPVQDYQDCYLMCGCEPTGFWVNMYCTGHALMSLKVYELTLDTVNHRLYRINVPCVCVCVFGLRMHPVCIFSTHGFL